MISDATLGDLITQAQPLYWPIKVRECPPNPESLGRVELHEGEIHVWHLRLGMRYAETDRYRLLSPSELERMARFKFDTDRNSFLFCRSTLRMLLASYLGTPPAELCFAYSAHGKPNLAAPSGELEFNVSHSAGIALFAFCQRRKIGVDVERIRRDLNVQDIAKRFFSPEERQELFRMPATARYKAFFSCWTRKEAFVKALGEGLSCPLDSFDVSVAPDEQRIRPTTRPDASEAERWRIYSVNSFAGYAAAVVVGTEYD